MKNWKATKLLVFAGAIFVFFQNCNNVNIARQEPPVASYVGPNVIDMKICPSTSLISQTAPFKINQVYILNLTTTLFNGKFFIDSDIDGLPDQVETNMGYDPVIRRTSNQMLDGVCQRLGGPTLCVKAPTCSGAAIGPGLTDCDLAHFRPPTSTGVITGIDSDIDGIPDLIEVLRGASPVDDDAYADNDQDGAKNIAEILIGTDINNAASVSPEDQIHFSKINTDETCVNNQKIVSLGISKISYVETLGVLDSVPLTINSKTIDLSHAAGENVIGIFYVSEAVINNRLKRELYVYVLKLDPKKNHSDVHLTENDFIFLGEVD